MTFSDKDLYKRFLVMIMSVLVVVISFSSLLMRILAPSLLVKLQLLMHLLMNTILLC